MEFYHSAMSKYAKSFELPIGVHVADPQVNTSYHSHEFCEVAIVSAGSGRQRIYGRGFVDAVAKDVFILPTGTTHGYSDVDGMVVINVLFSPERIPIPELDIANLEAFRYLSKAKGPKAGPGGQFLHFRLNEAEFARVKDIALEMNEMKRNPRQGGTFMLYALLLELLGRLCLCENLQARRPERYRYIDKAVEAINKSQGGIALPLDALAKRAGMSERNMRRQFKRATGTAPSKYLIEQRVRKGAELLLSSDLPVGEIALRCGFCDGSYFCLQFKRLLGMAPKAYRKQKDFAKWPNA